MPPSSNINIRLYTVWYPYKGLHWLLSTEREGGLLSFFFFCQDIV